MIPRKLFRPYLRRKRLEMGRNMTCCVAAICHDRQGNFIVTAADRAITYGNMTAEVYVNKSFMTKNWVVMSAGASGVTDIIGEEFSSMLHSGTDTAPNARRYLRKVFNAQLAEWCANSLLAPYNLDME